MSAKQIELRVANLDCEHDAVAIERGLADFSGLTTLKVYPKSAKVSLSFDPAVTNAKALKDKLDALLKTRTGKEMARKLLRARSS